MKVTTDACLFGAWTGNELKNKNAKSKSVLDIGTGTGLLPMMIAQQNESLSIDAIEIDKEAFEQAGENVNFTKWQTSINILHGDARNFSFTKKYDAIISNPPFYENELNSDNAKKNTAHHSSELSFNDLMILINNYLAPSGCFYLLLPFKREKEIKQLLKKHELFISKEVCVRQSTKHDFFRIMIAGTKNKDNETGKEEISIRDDKEEYTDQFIRLLKEYYLYL
jgi:tRNA1Val (adenine37-N6)-methyltransferase